MVDTLTNHRQHNTLKRHIATVNKDRHMKNKDNNTGKVDIQMTRTILLSKMTDRDGHRLDKDRDT